MILKLLIVDDHHLFAQGISAILAHALPDALIDEAYTQESAILKAQNTPYDLVIADIHMPLHDGRHLLDNFKSQQMLVPVLLVSAEEDWLLIKKRLEAGALGFIHKSSSADEMIKAIDAVLETGHYLSESSASSLNNVAEQEGLQISVRQSEVLQCLSQGMTNRQIGEALAISETTVKSHITALFNVLSVQNRIECIRKAEQLNLLT